MQKDVTPVHQQWSDVSFELNHQCYAQNSCLVFRYNPLLFLLGTIWWLSQTLIFFMTKSRMVHDWHGWIYRLISLMSLSLSLYGIHWKWMTYLMSTYLVKIWFLLDVIIHFPTFLICDSYSVRICDTAFLFRWYPQVQRMIHLPSLPSDGLAWRAQSALLLKFSDTL